MTFLAIKLVGSVPPGTPPSASPDYSEYIKHVGPAFYLALAGFLLAGVGGVIGPMRKAQGPY